MASFSVPTIQDNPTGWGPCALPDIFKDMPYQPFAKGDRLGKVADWTGATYQDRRYTNKYSSQFGQGNSQYAYFHEEDESTFHLVDSSKQQKPLFQRQRKFQQQQRNLRRQQQQKEKTNVNMQILTKSQKNRERDRLRQVRKWQKQYGNRIEQKNQVQIKHRDASVQVKDTWAVIEEMDFPRLAKLSLPNIGEPEDVQKCGSLEFYDKTYDRVNTKTERRLKRINRVFHKVTTTDDPVIRQLAKTTGNVFATEQILATLMCATRSVYSWDILVQRVGNKLFFDKRDDSEFDLLTVSETAQEPPQDEGNSINSPHNLALEATFINHNFSQQVLKPVEKPEDRLSFENPNPFIQEKDEEKEVASVAYRYRKWDLGNGITLVCRCEHDAVMIGPNGENQFINIKSLNEWDSKLAHGVDWRQKLDTQRGAVVATELKNNSCKLAKWTVSSLLGGSDQVKFGYVSRASPRDSTRHVILGTHQFKPSEFANQINLNLDNAWGILRCIVDTCMKLKEGKYLIMKDPNKPVIRIYDIPDDTFESDDDDEDDDDEDDEDSDEDDDDDETDDEDDEDESEEESDESEEEEEKEKKPEEASKEAGGGSPQKTEGSSPKKEAAAEGEEAPKKVWGNVDPPKKAWATEEAPKKAWATEEAPKKAWATEEAPKKAWATEEAPKKAWATEEAPKKAVPAEEPPPPPPKAPVVVEEAPPPAKNAWATAEPAPVPAKNAWGLPPAGEKKEAATPPPQSSPAKTAAEVVAGTAPPEPTAPSAPSDPSDAE